MGKITTNLLLAVALTAIVLATEPFTVDYSSGHFGWVSLHSLSIAKNTRFNSFLVGYTCNYDDFLHYFSRYPIPFNLLTKVLLVPFEANLKLHLYLSRQLMNLIYIATVYILFLIAKNFLRSDTKALVSALLSSTGFIILRYKNMYHFDQPGLLAFLIFVLILSKYELTVLRANCGKFLLSVALLSMMGRCYIILFGCLIWLALEALVKFNAGKNFQTAHFNLILPISAFLVSSLTISVNLLFNVIVESYLNGTSILNTSVIGSAIKRLGLNQDFNLENKKQLGFLQFSIGQFKRFSSSFIPESLTDIYWNSQILRIVIMLGLVILLGSVLSQLFIRLLSNQDSHRSAQAKVQIILFATGPVWLFVMKNLSAFHAYTDIYYIGTYLVLWIVLLNSVQKIIFSRVLLFIVALSFAISLFRIKQLNTTIANPINYSALDRYAQVLNAEDNPTVYVEGGHRNFIQDSPYALCYFLPGANLVKTVESADYTLEKINGNDYSLRRSKF